MVFILPFRIPVPVMTDLNFKRNKKAASFRTVFKTAGTMALKAARQALNVCGEHF
jgi:hypothetical protein